ncbi:MAG: alpha-2-macroglobulin family protein, partial [Bacteroidetes bacterium]|nr:alpha-2-macroglobulin family protein [Bacteroidota bacterium]
PDPYAHYYAPRALEVAGYDIYPLLLPELSKTQASRRTQSTGGSEDSFLGRRQNPLANRRVKLVSFWSGTLKADMSGTVRYSFDIPQFNGSLRIMAVAWKGNQFGHAEQAMIVADPIVISPGIPRFFSPGDTVQMPVTLTNTTTQHTDVTAVAEVEGPLQLVGPAQRTLTLRANSEGRLTFRLAAQSAIGEAKIRIRVQGLGEQFWDETEVTVRPPSTLQFNTGAGSLTGGKSEEINLSKDDFLPASRQARLIVSRNPALQYVKDLGELVRYPHGCLEQTVSQAFPQVYFQDLAAHIAPRGFTGTPAYHVQQAIFKLQSMQTYGGGLTYWPGGDEEGVSWWGSAYAAHFLVEADKAGFEVNRLMLNKLLNYLQQQAGNRSLAYYTFLNGQRSRYVSRETIYSLFVLTLSGRKPTGQLNYYRQRMETLTPDSRYLLAASYALLGDMKSWNTLVPPAYGNQLSAPETGGTYASPVRDRALALYVLLEADPKHAQVPSLAKTLAQQMGQVRYLSTQERSFAFMALGKLARRAAQSTATATLTANGQPVGVFLGQDLVLDNVAGKQVQIQCQGEGTLYYFWETSGISASGAYTEEDSKLKVRRTFYARKGGMIGKPVFRQNELVVVELTLQAERGDVVENIALTDLLPAGLEIENPRLSAGGAIEWLQNVSQPQHMDIRDDRIHFFTGLSKGEIHTYYYLARAVTVGKFRQGPASADAMYDGSYHSYHGGGWVEVLEPDGGSGN